LSILAKGIKKILMKYVRSYSVLFGITTLIAVGVFIWVPEYRDYLIAEDSLVENVSAFFYLVTFFLSLVFLLKSKEHRKTLFVLSAVGLLGFLEEISFGERIFGLTMPKIAGDNIDGAHDFFTLGYKFIYGLVEEFEFSYTAFLPLLIGIGAIILVIVTLRNLKLKFPKLLVIDTRALDNKEKKKIGIFTACWLGIIITTILSINILDDLVSNLVMTMYMAEPSSLWGQLFSAVASNHSSIPVDLYISKSLILFHRLLTYGFFLISSPLLLLFIWQLPNLIKPLVDYFRKIPKNKWRDIITNRYHKQTYILAFICVSLVFFALVIDLEIIKSDFLYMLEEIFEMNAAIALIFCSLSVYNSRASKIASGKSA
jgi:hypothetical protein